ncbi:hypothetical protein [Streptomyces sp. 43Y-GA-1]|uniref:hypothetical protein n=1 Tax=Streptomyces sp. 43Y-GA-1 TaxID=2939435 RepID=UPI0020BD56C8|nr:hypothetical protein [Streptomyces sp. 43Y-GA-1]MCL6293301.1 hypothetical protein [Streptomyces sp. 43Y-GA-1]
MERRGYWREPAGSAVPAAEAQEVWADEAYRKLADVSRTYHAVITYKELGEWVQKASGVYTSALLQNWIGGVLGRVVREAHRRGDPPLTALVVHTEDGMVGVGYKEVLGVRGEPPLEADLDREYHAADARLECYRYYGAELPRGGGVRALAPRLEATVMRQASRAAAAVERPICPRCFIQLPATRVCDSCSFL